MRNDKQAEWGDDRYWQAVSAARSAADVVRAYELYEAAVGAIVWEPDAIASYVLCCYGVDGDEPGDCYTRIGVDPNGAWWVDDGDDTERVDVHGPYPSRAAAVEAAESIAADADEALAGEDAEKMGARRDEEAAGEEDPTGSAACPRCGRRATLDMNPGGDAREVYCIAECGFAALCHPIGGCGEWLVGREGERLVDLLPDEAVKDERVVHALRRMAVGMAPFRGDETSRDMRLIRCLLERLQVFPGDDGDVAAAVRALGVRS